MNRAWLWTMTATACAMVVGCANPEAHVNAVDAGAPSGAVATAVPAPGDVILVPGTSLGPLRLGALKREIAALGLLQTHPRFSAMTVPYNVAYDGAGKAKRIGVSLKYAPGDVRVGATTIPRDASYDEAFALLGDCKQGPPMIGGGQAACRGGAVGLSVGSGSPSEVWVDVASAP